MYNKSVELEEALEENRRLKLENTRLMRERSEHLTTVRHALQEVQDAQESLIKVIRILSNREERNAQT